ncbi:MAG TPA: hypothetical protein H9687_08355 [Firmicutes bacterium]|nr:hypothetical protein [Bacillota bacterium]
MKEHLFPKPMNETKFWGISAFFFQKERYGGNHPFCLFFQAFYDWQ